jgi:large subunit ribosomal protein L4
MPQAKLYNQAGDEKGEIKLSPKIFEIEVNENLIHQVLVAILANRRQLTASTKDRSEVRGGGAKPWKQKGTGRARHGSRRSPLWAGGGVTFGPTTDRNFCKKVNKKMRQKATLSVLSDKAATQSIAVLENLEVKEPKTKIFRDLFIKMKLKKVLLITESTDQNIVKSTKNIQKCTVLTVDSLNVYDLVHTETILITKDALDKLEKIYLAK